MPEDDVSQGELVRTVRRIERMLEGVVQRAVYDVQMAQISQALARIQEEHKDLREQADERAGDDRRRNWLVGVALLGPIAGALFNLLVTHK